MAQCKVDESPLVHNKYLLAMLKNILKFVLSLLCGLLIFFGWYLYFAKVLRVTVICMTVIIHNIALSHWGDDSLFENMQLNINGYGEQKTTRNMRMYRYLHVLMS